MRFIPTIVGLCVALGGPLLLFSPLGTLLGEPKALSTLVLGQLFLWFLGFLLILIIIVWEKLPLSSVGLNIPPLRSNDTSSLSLSLAISLIWGLLTAVLLLYIITPLGVAFVEYFQLGDFHAGISKLQGLPTWYLIWTGVTAGVIEELLYRGYLIERLSLLTGKVWVGGILSVIIFTLVHIPFWGLGLAIFTVFSGVVLTALYIYRRDLIANAIAHGFTGIIQLTAINDMAIHPIEGFKQIQSFF
ncbi:MAG: CPBP family intramembrane glutamic endopeptidase [Cyanobacteria bacterium P01_A01_bin.84]